MSRASVALVIYTVWLGLAFGFRTLLHWRRTGSTGFQGISGKPGSLEWFAGVLFIVALLGGFLGALLHASAGSIDRLESQAILIAGVVVSAIGVVLTVMAQANMGASWRIGVDESDETDLVTGSAFQIVRNPIFTAMLVTAVGLSLVVPNPVSFGSLLALLLALEIQVRLVEEPFLRARHGDGYATYARKVGRFLPGIGRLR